MKLFPYEPRKNQKNIIELFFSTLNKKGNLVLESGTGTGKTICALAPTLEYAIQNKKKVLYITRTNSQQRQVIYELKQISYCLRIYGIGMQGRKNMCPITKRDHRFRGGTSEELSLLCSDKKRATIKSVKEGNLSDNDCKYYANFLRCNIEDLKNWAFLKLPTVEETFNYLESKNLCPYETNKKLIEEATIVTVPYIFFFNPFIRRNLLDWMNCQLDDIILIVDEAHNIPDYGRDIMTNDLSIETLKIARKEANEFGNPILFDDVYITQFLRKLQELLKNAINEYVLEEDGFVPPHELRTELMHHFKITSKKLNTIVEDLITNGEIIKDKRRKEGKLARSFMFSVGTFLLFWFDLEAESYTKLVYSGKNSRFEAYCLDPSISIDIVNQCHSSFHISGTLKPLDEYRDSIGLMENTFIASFPSPFPKENRSIFYSSDVTTKYEEILKDGEIIKKLENYVINISNALEKNVVIFFPSFKLMDKFLDDGIHFNFQKPFYKEEQGISQKALTNRIEKFKSKANAVLFSVVGGRVSEGIDFPGKELEIVVLIGIPYPKPTAKQRALQHYYEVKFGKGWEYTVKAPTTRKILQSIGRLIRNENDKGVAIILDKRAIHFKEHLENLSESNIVVGDLVRFFKERNIS